MLLNLFILFDQAIYAANLSKDTVNIIFKSL